jgi:hypothetical protein
VTDAPVPPARARLPIASAFVAVLVFAVLVTANSGGYRYGASDQAYYVPALLAKMTPGLFPRDVGMLESQGRFSVFDEVLAAVATATGGRLPLLFAAGYVLTIGLFAAAALGAAATLYRSRWSAVALLAALALRHQVLGTGVNSFEGYFHPRVLAFSIGFLAVVSLLRDRRTPAVLLAALSMVVHPTTGAWFGGWAAVALVVNARTRRGLTAGLAAVVLLAAGAAVGALALRGSLVVMDAAWLEAIASKRYLFPNTWKPATWAVNAIAPLVIAASYGWRRRAGQALPTEAGVVAGCLALVVVFLASLPFVAAHVAFAVQVQASRMFWHVELLATVYLVWLAVDVPLASGGAAARAAGAFAIALVIAGAARGAYILQVQFDRPLVRVDLVEDDWQAISAWARDHTPPGARFLVDPHHAGRYGVSFRVSAARDVFLETVKDSAMATYSREVALSVVERQRALPSFDALTPAEALALARRYDLHVLVTERPQPLPELHRHGRFIAYDVGPAVGSR